MARQALPAEINNFVQGIITEASPLNFPPNASVDEDNFILFKDGSRERRLGIDLESNYQTITTSVDVSTSGSVATSSFLWYNAGGNAAKKVLVVQTANQLRFFDFDSSPLSSGLITSYSAPASTANTKFSMTVVDGILVVAFGEREIVTFSYNSGTITNSSYKLLMRDLFGVEDIDPTTGKNLREGQGASIRPTVRSSPHLYNLRNQTWQPPRMHFISEYLTDTVEQVFVEFGYYPSNSDNANSVLFANANDSDNRTALRFNRRDLPTASVSGTEIAPMGFFIIDAMARGSSRLAEVQAYDKSSPATHYWVSNLPKDTTPGGAKVVQGYAGRVWYAGFSGEVIDGDANSPRMSSYVLYSQVVNNQSDVNKCYQEADPTSYDDPTLVATDGGFIRLDGASNIIDMVNIGQSLVVIAENGVWQISGGSGYGFSADNNFVKKVTNKGAVSPGATVVVESTVFYWGDDAIYQIEPNQFGDLVSNNISNTRIQGLYDGINSLDKVSCVGIYDSYDRKVRWLYGNRLSDPTGARELVLDIELDAYYLSTPRELPVGDTPILVSPIQVPPYRNILVEEEVLNSGDQVQNSLVDVTYNRTEQEESVREVAYVAVTNLEPIEFTFASYRDTDFLDWKSVDGVGVDADAYIITGWTTGGDNQRYKQVPWLTFYMRSTETGFRSTPEGDIEPDNASSCLLQTRWDWTNSDRANRWSREIQLYRRQRTYFPTDVNEEFDDGYELVVTKNKLRGKGRSVAFKLRTEPGKDCAILGWSFIVGVNGNV